MEIKNGHLVIQMYEPHEQGDILGDCYDIPLEDLAEALAPYLTAAFAELAAANAKERETFSREDLELAFREGSKFGNYSAPFENMNDLESNEHWRDGRDRALTAIIERKKSD